MAQVSVSEAAKLVSRDRKTIYRLIKTGQISATTGDNGQRQVETSELIRFFGEIRQERDSKDSGETVSLPQDETGLRHQIELLEMELRMTQDMLNLVSREKDAHIETLEKAVRLLEMKPKKPWWKFGHSR